MSLFIHTPNNEKYNRKEYEDRYDVKESGIIYDKLKKRIVNINYSGKCANSYPTVILFDKEGNRCQLVLHKLLASYFIPKTNDEQNYVNHIDGNKSNFSLSNLEWVTLEENTKKAYENNQMGNLLLSRKLDNGKPEKFREIRAREIIKDIMDGYDNTYLAQKYNLGFRYISAVRRKIKFKHIWDELFPNEIVPKSYKEFEIKPSLKLSKFDKETQLVILDKLRYNTNISVAVEYGIDPSVLSRARLNQTWVDSYEEYLADKLIPLPLKPLIDVIVPKYYLLGDRELQLSALLNTIEAMLKSDERDDVVFINDLNKLCAYWCQIYFSERRNINTKDFDVLISVLKSSTSFSK